MKDYTFLVIKYAALFIPIFAMLLGLASLASAETKIDISNNEANATSEVKVENNSSKSTVCINGKCTTSENGNIYIRSEDDKIKVDITDKSTSDAQQATPTTQPTTTSRLEAEKNGQTQPTSQPDLIIFLQAELKSIQDFFTQNF